MKKYTGRKVKEYNMWICPQCETQNIDEAKMCLSCGVGRICKKCQSPMSGDVCQHCSQPYEKTKWLGEKEFNAIKAEKAAAEKAAAEKAAAEKAAAEKAAAEKAAAEKAAAEKAAAEKAAAEKAAAEKAAAEKAAAVQCSFSLNYAVKTVKSPSVYCVGFSGTAGA